MANERRQAPRIKVNLRARWEGEKSLQEADVTSLSRNGCFVLSGGRFAHRELIRLELMFPEGEPINVWAEVVDAADEIGFALRFTSLAAEDETRLTQYIEEHLSA
jgi:PilZ domain